MAEQEQLDEILELWQKEFNPKNNPPMPVTLYEDLCALMDRVRIEQMELLRWKYKELNDQTIDFKFLDAYNILYEELKATKEERKK